VGPGAALDLVGPGLAGVQHVDRADLSDVAPPDGRPGLPHRGVEVVVVDHGDGHVVALGDAGQLLGPATVSVTGFSI